MLAYVVCLVYIREVYTIDPQLIIIEVKYYQSDTVIEVNYYESDNIIEVNCFKSDTI